MWPPWQFALNKTPPARPNLGFTICHLSLFPLGSADSRVIFIFPPPPPPGQCFSKCWSEPSNLWGHLGETRGLVLLVAWLIRCCPENEICGAPIGTVGASGGFAGFVLPLSKCLVNRDSETDRVFQGEGISFVGRESLWWSKLGHPCRV